MSDLSSHFPLDIPWVQVNGHSHCLSHFEPTSKITYSLIRNITVTETVITNTAIVPIGVTFVFVLGVTNTQTNKHTNFSEFDSELALSHQLFLTKDICSALGSGDGAPTQHQIIEGATLWINPVFSYISLFIQVIHWWIHFLNLLCVLF